MPRLFKLAACLLIFSGVVSAQTLPEYSRDDTALLLEYDRYSLKIHRPDSTPLLRIYGSGRVEVYYSIFSPKAGLYQTQLSPAELDTLVAQLVNNGLHLNASSVLAETSEEAAIAGRAATAQLYYSSESTVSLMTMFWDGAGDDPLVVENLQETDRRFSALPQVSELAAIERQLLDLASGDLGAPIAGAKSITPEVGQ